VWLPDLRILASHPVQYQAPLFRALVNEGIEIEVGFYHKGAAFQGMYDAEFGRNLSWDVDLLAGYPYRIFGTEQTDYGYSEQLRAAPGLLSWVLSDRRTPLLLFGWVTELFWYPGESAGDDVGGNYGREFRRQSQAGLAGGIATLAIAAHFCMSVYRAPQSGFSA